MFVVKLFRNGTRNPNAVEFYSIETPVIKVIDDPDFPAITHQIEVAVSGSTDMVNIYVGDDMFIENDTGVTIHSIRSNR